MSSGIGNDLRDRRATEAIGGAVQGRPVSARVVVRAVCRASLGVVLAALVGTGPAAAFPQSSIVKVADAWHTSGLVHLAAAKRRAAGKVVRPSRRAAKHRGSRAGRRIAEQTGAGSLNDELVHMLRTHPRLLAGQERVKAAAAGVREAWGPYFPRVNIDGNIGHAYVDSPARRSSPGKPFRGGTNSVGGELRLNVFDGFGKDANLSQARLRRLTAGLEHEAQRQQTLFRGITAYLNVLRQGKLLELARLSEQIIMRQLRLEDERVRRGSGLTVDVLQSKSRLQLAKTLRVQVEGDQHTATSRYIQVFGHTPRTGLMRDPVPPATTLPKTLELALSEAKTDNPSLKKAAREIDIADQRRRAAASPLFPRIDLVIEGRRDSSVDGIPGIRSDYAFLVKMTWELFNGFATQSRVIKAARLRAAAQNDHRFVHREVADEARIAWHRLRTERQREELLANAINIAEAVFRARRRLRAAGKETVINVLDAETELNRARLQHTAARYDAALAVYRLHFTLGQLTPSTLGLPGPKTP
ncbi:MAG TPA: TolC family protein [Alphaproteobacteria bacterium]|nr:TolC family protein [Alphaproteobacteria bacterium]